MLETDCDLLTASTSCELQKQSSAAHHLGVQKPVVTPNQDLIVLLKKIKEFTAVFTGNKRPFFSFDG